MKNIYLILISLIFVINAFAQPADTANFIIKNGTAFCKESIIEFENQSNDFPYHTYVWDYGDKSKKDTVHTRSNVKHAFKKDGQYTVTLTIIDISNYDTVLAQKRKINIIKIYRPNASGFTAKADDFLTYNYTFKVSENFKPFDPSVWQYSWNFGDGETSNDLDSLSVFHGFPNENKDPGYKVQLKVHLNPNNPKNITLSNNKPLEDCFDTATVFIKVKDGFFKNDSSSKNIPLIPNVFTPNKDGQNDEFVLSLSDTTTANALNDNDIFVFKTNGENIFKFWVYNRYGGLVYKTESKSIVWNGKSSSGEDLNSGVYYYVIESDATDKHHNTAGVIHIFRE